MSQLNQIQRVSYWTGYQKIVPLKVTSPTTIGNCRSIPIAPTDIRVVYNMKINIKKTLTNLRQPDPFLRRCNIKIGRLSQSEKLLLYYWKTYQSIRF